MKQRNIKKDFEKELQNLRNRGATGISVFLAQGKTVSAKEYMREMIMYLRLMNKMSTKKMSTQNTCIM